MPNDAISNAEPVSYLRDILAIAAENTPLEAAAVQLLELAAAATGAAGGRILLFVEPRLSISVGSGRTWSVTDERLAQALGDLLPGMSPEPVAFGRNGRRSLTAFVAPVADERVIGGVVLLFRGEVAANAADVLTDIATGLRICITRARAERRDARQPLIERALRAIPDPVIVLDVHRSVLALNAAGESAFGITSQQAEGRAVTELPGLEPLAEALAHDALPDEWVREGSDKVYAPRLQPLSADDDAGYVLAFTDLTRHRLRERNQLDYIQVVTHDLRSPLAGISLSVDLLGSLLEGEDYAPHRHALRRIENGLNTLNAHIDNIQDAGRYDPETGFYRMTRQPVSLREVTQRILEHHHLPPGKTLTVTAHVDDNLPLVNVDPFMVERAVLNLVDNAIKYTPNGGDVDVIVRREGDRIVVRVRDTGLGISPEDQKQLFRRHIRLRRREFVQIKGTGLGLFIVRSVALRHGGDAWVESREGAGSTFCFSIPLSGENVLVPEL